MSGSKGEGLGMLRRQSQELLLPPSICHLRWLSPSAQCQGWSCMHFLMSYPVAHTGFWAQMEVEGRVKQNFFSANAPRPGTTSVVQIGCAHSLTVSLQRTAESYITSGVLKIIIQTQFQTCILYYVEVVVKMSVTFVLVKVCEVFLVRQNNRLVLSNYLPTKTFPTRGQLSQFFKFTNPTQKHPKRQGDAINLVV